MKKFLLTASAFAMFCLSPFTYAATMSDLTERFFQSETYSVAITKDTTEALKSKFKQVTTDTSFTKLDLNLGDNDESDENGADEDDDGGSPVSGKLYLSSDKNTIYFFIDEGTPGFPNYAKVALNELDGSKNTSLSLYTNVTDAALSFKGSNDKELHVRVAPQGLILELLGLSSDGDQKVKIKKFKSLMKSFTKIK